MFKGQIKERCVGSFFIRWVSLISRKTIWQFKDCENKLEKASFLKMRFRTCRHWKWQIFKNGEAVIYLSTLKAHRLSTVIPTDAFWRNGTSLHRKSPNGLSSNGHFVTSSCKKKKSIVHFYDSSAIWPTSSSRIHCIEINEMWMHFLIYFKLLCLYIYL